MGSTLPAVAEELLREIKRVFQETAHVPDDLLLGSSGPRVNSTPATAPATSVRVLLLVLLYCRRARAFWLTRPNQKKAPNPRALGPGSARGPCPELTPASSCVLLSPSPLPRQELQSSRGQLTSCRDFCSLPGREVAPEIWEKYENLGHAYLGNRTADT
ncbi:zinc finger SWIM domain-containing protein 7 isoform X2 [Oxyura jamaicensis]|uniref:zinc finger SWIM domain-containing protein 7 isoform X2 n=1 Tax=Oxyura jamaicensis TaxID=8884 RepID=UPI0015A731AB|nr:zinc finger SWIM domain-containing protein 7 isoform X2 [Oxyura jamaicensis]